MGMISPVVYVRLACVVALILMIYFDYLYAMKLFDNWETYTSSAMAPSLMHLYYVGLVGYATLNLLIVTVVRWSWK